jgi:hypothetical protein
MNAWARLRIELEESGLDWDHWCAQRGLTAQEAAQQLILGALQRGVNLHEPARSPMAPWADADERHHRVVIRLTPSVWAAVKQRAVASGFTGNRWIVALVRAHLANEPQFDERELTLLATSNQQLAGLVRQLGASARDAERASDADHTPQCGGAVGAQQFEELKRTLDAHLRVVAALMRANLDRWRR